MLFQNVLPAAVLLVASTTQAAHITWRKHSTTTCEDSGSDNWYTAEPGQCNDLIESDHGIEIWTDDRNCNFYTYPNTDCSGSRQKTLDGRGCHSLQGNNWGLRMECD
ncbi:hypothetical protein INS49_010794 [Diaporthe citri]|uniref:uncharacterized protein n=1 Tax=Diaporthe citri TaxID=83186 RepID=UPI001C81B447|nr:uncharacterized protein INS49_010794 [Diaporthe citri]KAG6359742.1 hypothetical protein INS49_010794 [Diaporthe citri]